jgi:hypothetical protein
MMVAEYPWVGAAAAVDRDNSGVGSRRWVGMSHGGDSEMAIELQDSIQEVEGEGPLAGKGLAGLGLVVTAALGSAEMPADPWAEEVVNPSSLSWI